MKDLQSWLADGEPVAVAETGRVATSPLWCDRFVDVDGSVVEARFTGKGRPRRPAEAGAELLPSNVETAWVQQVHGADVAGAAPGLCGSADALVSGEPDLALVVVTADCVPVLLAGGGQVAAVHAGWRGVVAGVVGAALDRFSSPPEVAWIGPAISGRVYEVSEDVAQQVVAAGGSETEGPRGRPHVDLQAAVAFQLSSRGVREIRTVAGCTFSEPDRFWSYRRDGAGAGRNMSWIWRTSQGAGS